MESTGNEARWAELLRAAVEQPGIISEAYNAFHNYSIGNQILALLQCHERGLAVGPIASYKAWQLKGRQVRKGEKAIELCMPVTCKRKVEAENGEEETATFTRFVFKRNWFVVSQTDGQEIEAQVVGEWNRERALAALSITEAGFETFNGNVQGYANKNSIAINPVAAMPHKTTFHELAHVVLGHTAEGSISDDDSTPRSLREAEAESVAMICCDALGLPGAEFSRGYIQNWLAGDSIPERSAQRIFKAADSILKAGRVNNDESGE